jgi:hypothetical protein
MPTARFKVQKKNQGKTATRKAMKIQNQSVREVFSSAVMNTLFSTETIPTATGFDI